MKASKVEIGDIIVDLQVDGEDQPSAEFLKVSDISYTNDGMIFHLSDGTNIWLPPAEWDVEYQVFRDGEWV